MASLGSKELTSSPCGHAGWYQARRTGEPRDAGKGSPGGAVWNAV